MFEIYGAALVLNNDQKYLKFLTEEFGVDMYDHFLDYCEYGVLVFQDQKKYLFLNDNYIFDRGVVRDIQNFEEVEVNVDYDYLYASCYRGFNHI